MIIEIGLLLATYAGAKFYENLVQKSPQKKSSVSEGTAKFQEEKIEEKKTVEETEEKKAVEEIEEKKTVEEIEGKKKVEEQKVAQEEIGFSGKNRKHYVKASLATLGLFALKPFFPILTPLGIASYLYTSLPYMKDVEKAVVEKKKVNVDVLLFFGDSLTFGLGQYFTASVGLWLMHLGKSAVDKAKDNSKSMITEIFAQLPQKVWILLEEGEVEIPLEEIKANDVLIVNAGGVIPVDGRIVQGMVSIDQHMLTGESQPIEKNVGDEVYANTVVLSGKLHVQVEKSGEETTAAKIQDLLYHSIDFKSNLQLKGEKWANTATLPMFLGACAILPTFGVVPAVIFIQSHIGNEIRVLTTLATLIHTLHASRRGILVKDGRVLENLHEVDTFLFDKTGTLTLEEPQVQKIIACEPYQELEILHYAATAEQKQTHPIAQSILKYAETMQVHYQDIQDSKYKMGYGLTVFLEEETVRVGSARFLESEGLSIPSFLQKTQEQSHTEGNTIVFVGVNDQVAGAIELQPHLRPEAKETIQRLKGLGIQHFAIISGDHEKPTQNLAEALGINEYFAQVLPEQKAQIVEELQKQGRKVCFVGDGINDTIAMRKANASISLQGATNLAKDVAGTLLLEPNLELICDLYQFSQSLNTSLRKGLALTIIPSVINLGGAFFWNFSILGAKGLGLVFDVLGELNALQPPKDLRQQHSFLEKIQDGYQVLSHENPSEEK